MLEKNNLGLIQFANRKVRYFWKFKCKGIESLTQTQIF